MNTLDRIKRAASILIKESEKHLEESIKREHWERVARLDAYVSGMKQIQALLDSVFDPNED